jgi:putative spermidine/putrescine transport system substrate-binding protein
VLAYRKDRFRDKQPKTWADFWDPEKFPGPRAVYDDPRGTLEFALIADGVSLDKLYPLDVERAFHKLDEIKPHVRVWWTDGSQPLQLLLTESVVMSSAWNGRLYGSEQAQATIGYTWEGAALELDYWVVPRGSSNRDTASRFILFASLPYTLAKQTTLVGYGPVNTTALEYVSEDVRLRLPTYPTNWDLSFVVDAVWWSANEEKIKTRWLAWKAK